MLTIPIVDDEPHPCGKEYRCHCLGCGIPGMDGISSQKNQKEQAPAFLHAPVHGHSIQEQPGSDSYAGTPHGGKTHKKNVGLVRFELTIDGSLRHAHQCSNGSSSLYQ